MSEQTDTAQQSTTGEGAGCGCGCGGHEARTPGHERAAAPVVSQPLGEGYVEPEPVTAESMETADPTGIAANVMSVLADGSVQVAVPAQGGAAAGSDAATGVVPGHKPGNVLGLRDVSATGGGCGCGGHGHHHEHAHGEQASGGCACGAH